MLKSAEKLAFVQPEGHDCATSSNVFDILTFGTRQVGPGRVLGARLSTSAPERTRSSSRRMARAGRTRTNN